MIKLLLLIIIMGVSGCIWQNADITDVKKSIQACKNHGGLKNISIRFDSVEEAECVDGSEFRLSKVKLSLLRGE